MTERYLKIIIVILSVVLVIVLYLLYDMVFGTDTPERPEKKETFKSATPEGKLREISDRVKNR